MYKLLSAFSVTSTSPDQKEIVFPFFSLSESNALFVQCLEKDGVIVGFTQVYLENYFELNCSPLSLFKKIGDLGLIGIFCPSKGTDFVEFTVLKTQASTEDNFELSGSIGYDLELATLGGNQKNIEKAIVAASLHVTNPYFKKQWAARQRRYSKSATLQPDFQEIDLINLTEDLAIPDLSMHYNEWIISWKRFLKATRDYARCIDLGIEFLDKNIDNAWTSSEVAIELAKLGWPLIFRNDLEISLLRVLELTAIGEDFDGYYTNNTSNLVFWLLKGRVYVPDNFVEQSFAEFKDHYRWRPSNSAFWCRMWSNFWEMSENGSYPFLSHGHQRFTLIDLAHGALLGTDGFSRGINSHMARTLSRFCNIADLRKILLEWLFNTPKALSVWPKVFVSICEHSRFDADLERLALNWLKHNMSPTKAWIQVFVTVQRFAAYESVEALAEAWISRFGHDHPLAYYVLP